MQIDLAKDLDQVEKIKIQQSVQLIGALQKLIAKMLLGNTCYQDPTSVLEAIVDDNGESMSIYE